MASLHVRELNPFLRSSLSFPFPFLSHERRYRCRYKFQCQRQCQCKPFSFSFSSSPASLAHNLNHEIQLLCREGQLSRALQLLPHEPRPTQRTFELLILACCLSQDPSHAPLIHRSISLSPFHADPFLSSRLIRMYCLRGLFSSARLVLHDTPHKTIFVWNAMLRSLLDCDRPHEALSLFHQMVSLRVPLDSSSFVVALKSCIAISISSLAYSSSAPHLLKQIHCLAIRRHYHSHLHVATTLLDSYAKLGLVSYARQVFDSMPLRNLFSWSAILCCYVRNERPCDALTLFHHMLRTGDPLLAPNKVTLLPILQACGALAALSQGKILHAYVLRKGYQSITPVSNALISMYIKAGNILFGRRVFDSMDKSKRDPVSWNSLISGYGMHGFYHEAIHMFNQMVESGVSPTVVSFVSLLGVCSHCGLVEEGKRIFHSLTHKYSIVPRIEHYSCMVDLLGRAGQLDEAVKLIEEMPVEPNPQLWGSLLGACKKYGHVEYAELACSHLFKLEPKNPGNYVLLADVYMKAQMPEEVDRVKKLLEERSLPKLAGCSWIEILKKVYSFVSVDEMNPQIEEIHALLVELVASMKRHGYVPNTKVVLYDLEEEEKERMLLRHSEKLALAFGLINGQKGEVIRITKNLRLCEDCHSFTKLVSKFAKREIIVRDVNRFHHFNDGVCSCMDYW